VVPRTELKIGLRTPAPRWSTLPQISTGTQGAHPTLCRSASSYHIRETCQAGSRWVRVEQHQTGRSRTFSLVLRRKTRFLNFRHSHRSICNGRQVTVPQACARVFLGIHFSCCSCAHIDCRTRDMHTRALPVDKKRRVSGASDEVEFQNQPLFSASSTLIWSKIIYPPPDCIALIGAQTSVPQLRGASTVDDDR
jgi:hypothetical protein